MQYYALFTKDCSKISNQVQETIKSRLKHLYKLKQQNGILGVRIHGAMTPKFELGRDFGTMHLFPKFHHPMFTRSEVIVLTNKQTQLKTSNALRYATTLGN